MYHYWAYGLIVDSEIEFPELFPLAACTVPSVKLRYGKPPPLNIHPDGLYQENIAVTPTEYFLKVTGVAQYYVSGGKDIVVDPDEAGSIDLIRLYCLSNAFAAVLYQRKTIPLHCAAVLKEDKLVMIFGESGAGKSTTLAGLMKMGLPPFSDDVCVPSKTIDGMWTFCSSYPMMKFWKSTLEIESLDLLPNRKIREDMDKYGMYFHDSFSMEYKKPEAIFILQKSLDVDQPKISRLSGIELFKELDKNAYRRQYLGASALKMEHFIFFSELANQVPTFVLARPNALNSHKTVPQIIFQELKKLQNA